MQKKRIEKRRKAQQKKRNQQIIIIGVILVALFGAVTLFQSPATQTAGALPAEINVDTAFQKREEGAYILDVRTPEEWEEKHVPGATLITLDTLAEHVDEVPRDQEVVVICRSGNRSQTGRDILLAAGFEQVTSVAGGINDWIASGYPYVTGP